MWWRPPTWRVFSRDGGFVKADPFQIGDVLKDPKRFVVPIYQRTYAWTKGRQLERLFDSLRDKAEERLAGEQTAFPHYMGALLLSPRGKFAFGAIPVLDVVDGQQRLTTYQILLAALRDLATEGSATILAAQLATFLLNADTPLMKDRKVERYKLQATEFDRALSRDLIDLSRDELRKKYVDGFYKKGTIKEDAPLPLRAWWYLREQAEEFMSDGEPGEEISRLNALSAALLEDFRVIVITLDETDDAQVIFETLNSGGEPLAAMDLVRNDVFHRAIRRDEDPEELMEKRWSVFENPFWKQETIQGRIRKPRIDFFLAHTLAAETGKEVLHTELYARYKAYVATQNFPSVDAELDSLVRHAPTYQMLVAPVGSSPLAVLARQLIVFDVSTAYPLIFVIAEGAGDEVVEEQLYGLVSSYVVRRALCGLNNKAYNNTFLRVAAHLRAHGVTRESFGTAFVDAQGDSVKFPTDADVLACIRMRGQYGSIPTPRLAHILGALERASHGKFDETDGLRPDLTIEHVLPDKWMEHWPLADGSKAPLDGMVSAEDPRYSTIANRQTIKHTLGNLTLLTQSGNPRLGNLPYTIADDAVGLSKREALQSSLLRMNQEIAANPVWSEEQILARADVLAKRAVAIWPSPTT